MQSVRKHQFTISAIFFALALIALWLIQIFVGGASRPTTVPYSQFLTELRAGHVAEAHIATDRITAQLKPAGTTAANSTSTQPRTIVANRLPGIGDTALVQELVAHGVTFSGEVEHSSAWTTVLIGWLPFILLIGIYWFAMTRMARRGGPMSFGRSRAKVYDRNATERVTFSDVAGVDEAEAELAEVVSFLRNPAQYRRLGARIPKGVLLVGSPGTGKTLLARAVAGEANVPFFSLSGSEFVEMFVGVGAARMRDLFEQAKQRAPCIIFIDELDAIGRARGGVGAMATHDEREQTLNQLLVEMDGFTPGQAVIIMAATNRPEVLDPALLRPGRFDRHVVVDHPTVAGRLQILRVHSRRIKLGADVSLEIVARRTVGMVGADLANVVNEAALAAGRRGGTTVEQRDFEDAIDRIQLGLQKRGQVLTPEEKRRVAYHEGGHALAALSLDHANPVHRVTIIPRSIGALGATLQFPMEDRYLITRRELLDQMCVMLSGRGAEELVLHDISTGAQNDLERATETARQMVTRFGMTDALGPVTYGRRNEGRFLQTPFPVPEERTFSDETARAIDDAVRQIIDGAHERSLAILQERRAVLDRIADELLEKETLERNELEALVRAGGFEVRQPPDLPDIPALPGVAGD
ncbi:MAG TPA: ATP-dependent zinc metalloprotease FtsH [Gemmatimonadaceae bacterium]|nr:ATP-dependent zinc metalloprotease FtsH [Gemmatimonadaceae bacterium]